MKKTKNDFTYLSFSIISFVFGFVTCSTLGLFVNPEKILIFSKFIVLDILYPHFLRVVFVIAIVILAIYALHIKHKIDIDLKKEALTNEERKRLKQKIDKEMEDEKINMRTQKQYFQLEKKRHKIEVENTKVHIEIEINKIFQEIEKNQKWFEECINILQKRSKKIKEEIDLPKAQYQAEKIDKLVNTLKNIYQNKTTIEK